MKKYILALVVLVGLFASASAQYKYTVGAFIRTSILVHLLRLLVTIFKWDFSRPMRQLALFRCTPLATRR